MGRVSVTLKTDVHDLRQVPLDSLVETVESKWLAHGGEALLTISRRPSKGWTRELIFARPLTLSSSAFYELILWVDKRLDLRLPNQVEHDQRELLQGYHRLFSEQAPDAQQLYLERLHGHISSQEGELFPHMAELAPVQRALQELSYEHRGLEKGAEALGNALQAWRLGTLSKQQKDRLDLDYFHLLEHHLEREREALYPTWLFLCRDERPR